MTDPVIGGASIVLTGDKLASLGLDAGKTGPDASGIGLLGLHLGSGNVQIAADPTSIVNAGSLGVVGAALTGDVDVKSGIVNVANGAGFTIPGLSLPPISGGVLGVGLADGSVKVENTGVVTVRWRLFGVAGISTLGSSTVTIATTSSVASPAC